MSWVCFANINHKGSPGLTDVFKYAPKPLGFKVEGDVSNKNVAEFGRIQTLR